MSCRVDIYSYLRILQTNICCQAKLATVCTSMFHTVPWMKFCPTYPDGIFLVPFKIFFIDILSISMVCIVQSKWKWRHVGESGRGEEITWEGTFQTVDIWKDFLQTPGQLQTCRLQLNSSWQEIFNTIIIRSMKTIQSDWNVKG